MVIWSVAQIRLEDDLESLDDRNVGKQTYFTNGQSGRARISMISGLVVARTLYIV